MLEGHVRAFFEELAPFQLTGGKAVALLPFEEVRALLAKHITRPQVVAGKARSSTSPRRVNGLANNRLNGHVPSVSRASFQAFDLPGEILPEGECATEKLDRALLKANSPTSGDNIARRFDAMLARAISRDRRSSLDHYKEAVRWLFDEFSLHTWPSRVESCVVNFLSATVSQDEAACILDHQDLPRSHHSTTQQQRKMEIDCLFLLFIQQFSNHAFPRDDIIGRLRRIEYLFGGEQTLEHFLLSVWNDGLFRDLPQSFPKVIHDTFPHIIATCPSHCLHSSRNFSSLPRKGRKRARNVDKMDRSCFRRKCSDAEDNSFASNTQQPCNESEGPATSRTVAQALVDEAEPYDLEDDSQPTSGDDEDSAPAKIINSLHLNGKISKRHQPRRKSRNGKEPALLPPMARRLRRRSSDLPPSSSSLRSPGSLGTAVPCRPKATEIQRKGAKDKEAPSQRKCTQSTIDVLNDSHVVARYKARMKRIRAKPRELGDEIFYGRYQAQTRIGLFEEALGNNDKMAATGRGRSQVNRSGRSVRQEDDRVYIAHLLLNTHNGNPLAPYKLSSFAKCESHASGAGFKLKKRLVKIANRSEWRRMQKFKLKAQSKHKSE